MIIRFPQLSSSGLQIYPTGPSIWSRAFIKPLDLSGINDNSNINPNTSGDVNIVLCGFATLNQVSLSFKAVAWRRMSQKDI